MKFLFSIALTLLLTACGSLATTTETEATNGTQEEETSHESEVHNGNGGFLWKVQEGDTTVYLQGTIHVAYEDMYPLNPYLEAAYDEADVLLPEIDWPHADPSAGLSEEEAMELFTLEDGLTLSELLGEEIFEDLIKILEPQGLTGEMINHFKPWYITDLLNQQVLLSKDSKATLEGGVDYHYLERAAEDGKEIKELEGFIVSLLALDSMSMELQVERLKDTIDQSDMDVPEFPIDDLVDVWLAGDEETFIKYWNMTTYGEEYDDVFLFRRNSDNADIIDSLLQEDTDKTYLALIGAFHFITEPGVQHYLEEKGYTVERIY
ncbi:TraB/GumN family protein [Bacillus chungangensis]|uniref:Uncharacterized protein YbaP (TraB family) n=1 Tax=Bacillus chungangensis TaxID=587633 RepID=A0ABT9WN23_9BACI|nr:TraB/GumN family protein [Bacillus chungangensis]MDQ0174671.1 uncharacterized protein YbaP (TraB family) [Bacillus chungangensis]